MSRLRTTALPGLRGGGCAMTLPPHVQAEVRRVLDAAARRLLAEQLDKPKPQDPPQRSDTGQKETA